jgi:hypothetical protein
MNDEWRNDDDADRDKDQAPDEATFAREGPASPENDTGSSVAEMNRKAERALLRNITVEDQTE